MYCRQIITGSDGLLMEYDYIDFIHNRKSGSYVTVKVVAKVIAKLLILSWSIFIFYNVTYF